MDESLFTETLEIAESVSLTLERRRRKAAGFIFYY